MSFEPKSPLEMPQDADDLDFTRKAPTEKEDEVADYDSFNKGSRDAKLGGKGL